MAPTGPEAATRPRELRTGRLLLRPLRRDDAAAIAGLAGEPDVALRTARMPYPFALADAEAWLDEVLGSATGEPGEIVFALERQEDGAFLGAIGLVPGAGGAPAETGFWIGKPFWNRGYMTEALGRLVEFAFADLGLGAIQACALPDNAASIRVLEKAGFRSAGRTLRPAPARGGDREMVLMALIPGEPAR